jgi:hypothetical protein
MGGDTGGTQGLIRSGSAGRRKNGSRRHSRSRARGLPPERLAAIIEPFFSTKANWGWESGCRFAADYGKTTADGSEAAIARAAALGKKKKSGKEKVKNRGGKRERKRGKREIRLPAACF